MRKLKTFIFTLCLPAIIFFFSGCWNYWEIDKLGIVTGFTLDKKGDNYVENIEIVSFESQSPETKTSSKIVQSEGKTLFDVDRNSILVSGKRFFWSHAKVVIISQDIAKEGLGDILDLIYRDIEMRLDINPLISVEPTAKELLTLESPNQSIRSFEISEMLKAEKSLAKAPDIAFYQYINSIAGKNAPAILPAIGIETRGDKKVLAIKGTAILKKAKLVGFLDTDESKYLLFALNQVKEGLLIVEEKSHGRKAAITLDVTGNQTKIKPKYIKGKLTMDLSIQPEVSIGELQTTEDYIQSPQREKLIKDAETSLEDNVRKVIRKMQVKYNSDVLGFAALIRATNPSLWKKLEPDWDEVFRNLAVRVKAHIKVKNSALTSKPIKVGE